MVEESPHDDVIRRSVEESAGADAVAYLLDPENSSGISFTSTRLSTSEEEQNFEGMCWIVED